MKILYYDCFSGISGDMNLGAMIDLGVDREYLIQELSKLKVDDEFELDIRRDIRKGIEGTKVKVILKKTEEVCECSGEDGHKSHHSHGVGSGQHLHDDQGHELCDKLNPDEHHNNEEQEHNHEHNHNHSHNHEHSHNHGHDHNHGPSHSHKHVQENHSHEHVHRNLRDIAHIINSSGLNEKIKEISISIFKRVAEAEAKIHGKTIDEVHFHEVGATDSIVDIVGAAICIDYLKVDKVMCSSVELGAGFVKCAHGRFPVPAPATLEILKGALVKSGAVRVETTTPTGAAILATLADEFTDNMRFTIDSIGYGIGHRDTEIPNVLRVILAHN